LSFLDVFQQNSALKCVFSCLTVVQNFTQKSRPTCIAEILTKVTGATFYAHHVGSEQWLRKEIGKPSHIHEDRPEIHELSETERRELLWKQH